MIEDDLNRVIKTVNSLGERVNLLVEIVDLQFELFMDLNTSGTNKQKLMLEAFDNTAQSIEALRKRLEGIEYKSIKKA